MEIALRAKAGLRPQGHLWVPTGFRGVAHTDQVIGKVLEEMELQAEGPVDMKK